MMYQYFVKIVPTIYVKTDGEVSAALGFSGSRVLGFLTAELHVLLPHTQLSFLSEFVSLPQVVKTNQFSVTRHEKVANGLIGDQGLPGVFVLYELSPMMVKFTEKHRCGSLVLITL